MRVVSGSSKTARCRVGSLYDGGETGSTCVVKSKRDTRHDTAVIGSKPTNANDNEGIAYALAA